MVKQKKILLEALLIIVTILISSVIYLKINADGSTSSKINNKPIFKVKTEEKVVSLTFDINWAEKDYLYDILEVLDKYDVKATFFIMGGWVNYSEENKEKLIYIDKYGHEVANHSYIHPNFTEISNDRIVDELQKTDDIIYSILNKKPSLFRFPSGDYNEKVLKTINDLGYKCIQWNLDSIDYKEDGEIIEYDRVMKKISPGSIILFHNNAKYTPINLDKIISNLEKENYEFKTISDLIFDENYIINENGEQEKNNY